MVPDFERSMMRRVSSSVPLNAGPAQPRPCAPRISTASSAFSLRTIEPTFFNTEETADGPWFFDLLRQGVDTTAMRDMLIFGQAYDGGVPLDPTGAVVAWQDKTRRCNGRIIAPMKLAA